MNALRKIPFARLQSLLALVLMVVALSLASDSFLTADNGWNILRQISVNLCLSVGLTLIILTGGIDLSVGAILALSGAVAAGLLKQGIAIPALGVHLDFTVTGAILAGIGVGAALGACNGLTITRLRLPPFVATLAMLSIGRGLTLLWTGGFPITGLGATFGYIGVGTLLGVPFPVWEATVVVLLAVILCHRTGGRAAHLRGGWQRTSRAALGRARRPRKDAGVRSRRCTQRSCWPARHRQARLSATQCGTRL